MTDKFETLYKSITDMINKTDIEDTNKKVVISTILQAQTFTSLKKLCGKKYLKVSGCSAGGITGTTQTGTAPDANNQFNITDDSTEMILSAPGGHLAFYNYSAADPLRTAGTYTNISGTSSNGTAVVGTFDITINAAGGIVGSPTIKTLGSGNVGFDTITVQDSDLGGGGAANLTFQVFLVSNGVGQNASFTVVTNGTVYSLSLIHISEPTRPY